MTDSDKSQARARLQQLATESIEKRDPTGWFEKLYRGAKGDTEAIPWAHLRANPFLIEWVTSNQPSGEGKRALVVGCGLGDDAEAMAHYGFDVTAFDISPEAIAWARGRFPDSQVRYTFANALALPEEWNGQFDLVVEIYTLQTLPNQALREQVATNLARCISPGGSLLVICAGRDESDEPGSMPWPLTRADLTMFEQVGLREMSFEDVLSHEKPFFRHFRVHYQK